MAKESHSPVNSNGYIVELADILVRQEEHIILKDVNLNVKPGEFLYMIGRVGSGKSSLLKTLYAEIPLREGKGFAAGYHLHSIKEKNIPWLRRRMGIVFQDYQLLIDRNIYDNLLFVLKATGWKNQVEMDHRIREVLSEVDMVHKGYKMPHQLSGGEQQRIGIARALLNKPDLLLADEPTGNLDPDTSDELMKLLHQICKDGKTVIMATHNYNLIKKFPGRTVKCEDTRLSEKQQEEIDFDQLIM
ncbi:cell division ATP-binding protein FtsE [Natronoflexus pectinivorans]|uniref:Cell division ATP-binding protein FtsE n=1 Tax=Natronoflexus pectinivorans TaxID=682526 RepID=A0A4R2GG32_9BACT|nr:ATP-binding cassette domain-containing protein [Natronoflexus pectinivorans]TCO06921.1 cell division transport system ATP-binding protein [Natronoflexus pectinivorans]